MLQRAWARQRRHLTRLAHALLRLAPGKLAGAVTSAEWHARELVVTGWAHLPKREVVAVSVSVNGVVIGSAEVGTETPRDAAGTPYCARSDVAGWRAIIDPDSWPSGTVVLDAVALFDDGLGEALLPFELTSERPLPADPVGFGRADRPDDGTTVSAPVLLVSGWLRVDHGYDHVDIQFGDEPKERARLVAECRPDVAAAVADPAAPLCGWYLLARVPTVTRDEDVTLTVTASGAAGELCLATRTVRVVPPKPTSTAHAERMAALRARTVAVASQHQPARDGMHLLVVTHQLDLGGGQLYLHEMLRQLLHDGDMQCTVLAAGEGLLRDELEAWGATVHVTGPLPMDGLNYEARMLELCQLVAADGANVVMVNTMGSFWGVDLADRCGIPAVWSIHESFPLERFIFEAFGGTLDPAIEARLRSAFASAAAVVFEADATRRLFDSLGDPRRFIRIDYGIDLDGIDRYVESTDRAALRESLGIAPDDTVLLCMGTYEPRKAQGTLAVAFGRVAAAHPRAVMALVGANGTIYADGLQKVADRLDLGSRLRLIPTTEDIDAWYLVADGFVLTSDTESLPRSMLEAMAYGVPVIGSAVFGVPELLTDGDTGILVEPNSLATITDGLDRFLSLSAAERQAIGSRGRDLVRRERSSAHYAAAYGRLFEGLVRDPRALPADLVAG
jgi:D-inositol-3-phosphate glycosyltransferase